MTNYLEILVTDPACAYSGVTACDVAGITYRQLDYWARSEFITPSKISHGSGSRRSYSFRDLLNLTIASRLIDTGINFPEIKTLVDYVSTKEPRYLDGLTLASNGDTIYECVNEKEITELIAHAQAVFVIAVGTVMKEVAKNIVIIEGKRQNDAKDE